MKAARFVVGSVVALALSIAACASAPDDGARVNPTPAGTPRPEDFRPVARALMQRCGSIDCHGSQYRNMRLYGYGGERLAQGAVPDDSLTITTLEVTADFEAVVSVEPELFAQVIADKGASPERLTFYRKARGIEAHRAGRRLDDGDQNDCILSWLKGAVDTPACTRVLPEDQQTRP